MPVEHKVLGTIWDGHTKDFCSRLIFGDQPSIFVVCSGNHYITVIFLNLSRITPKTLDHISKAPTKLAFYIKKESIFHKIMKSVFLTTYEIFGDRDKKIISESKHTKL